MKKSQDKMPESLQEKESLTSSNALPTFDDVSNVYADLIKATEEMESETPKRTKGKKSTQEKIQSGVQEIEGTDIQLNASDIADMIAFPLDAYFLRNGKDPLSEHEKENLAKATANLANKYIPFMGTKYKEEFGFAIAVGVIFLSRMKVELDATITEHSTEPERTPEEKAA